MTSFSSSTCIIVHICHPLLLSSASARTDYKFDDLGNGTCATSDYSSGGINCGGIGATLPATLAKFTLDSGRALQDYYDVSLIDGYNLPMMVEAKKGSLGSCMATGCMADLNQRCPSELRIDGGDACKSVACDAFGKPKYCFNGAYDSPTCKPSVYAQMFKSALKVREEALDS
ncbi:thaumatin-like protein 1 [Senna tora]|uniref:Thaumatin-like protein 1 n=1 Tax=Senna tora TaxID=362788 RepID=A0A834XDT8_9FABA|nr:thaumatin-like protein 1 [Senna tora]